MSRAARVGACPGRMPRSPATERATTKSASPAQTSRSGVTRCRSSGTGLLPLSAEPPARPLALLDPAPVEERQHLKGVAITARERVERAHDLVQRHGLARH